MALLLAESLIEKGAFDPMDQGHRYWRWYSVNPPTLLQFCFVFLGLVPNSSVYFHTVVALVVRAPFRFQNKPSGGFSLQIFPKFLKLYTSA